MKSLLVLTDFSEAAFRAAEYACTLAEPLQIKRIVLFHAYQTIVGGTELPVTTADNNRRIYFESMEALALLHDRLKPLAGNAVTMDMLSEDMLLPGPINQRCREENIDMIVMGVSGKSGLEELLLGSTTAQMLEASELPVLIVPRDALIGRTIKTIVFTTNLEDFAVLPVNHLFPFLDTFRAELCVVNVAPGADEKYTPETQDSIKGLHALLEKYHPSFHYLSDDDVVKGILGFAGQHHASLIITVPKKRSFLSALFHKSVPKKLAYGSPVPLLSLPALHQE